jgi:hypothetical protein
MEDKEKEQIAALIIALIMTIISIETENYNSAAAIILLTAIFTICIIREKK